MDDKQERKKNSYLKAVLIGAIIVIFVFTVAKFLQALFTMLSRL